MTYAGLTTADKGALLDAKAIGAEWVARDEFMGEINGFIGMPRRKRADKYWLQPTGTSWNQTIPIDKENLQFVQWENPEPVNIDLALAQIAEMESKTEMIFGYPIEHLQKIAAIMHHAHITPEDVKKCADNFTLCVELTMTALKESMDKSMTEHIANLQAFYSPYTEGETK